MQKKTHNYDHGLTCFQLVPGAEEENEHLPLLASKGAGQSRPSKKRVVKTKFEQNIIFPKSQSRPSKTKG